MILKEMSLKVSYYRNIIIIASFILINLFSSCVTQREIEYLQDKSKDIKAFSESEFPDYKLKPNDELYIQINSLDEGAANVFSSAVNQSVYGTGNITPYGASLMSYSIDNEGYLLLPIVGNLKVKDKTIGEVSLILKDSLKNVLNQPIVSVKLVNRYISVLGEVSNPGHFTYSQEKLSVYDALGLAGDVLDYGNRNSVILLRNENGENLRINIDLTKSDLLTSDYYYLRPNDIVYVKPLKEKFWNMRQFPYTVLFGTISAITSILLIYDIYRPE